jgi:hypothetical protein
VSSRPLSRVKMCGGVSGCFSGAKVSQRPKTMRQAKPLASVPMTLGELAAVVVV